MLGQWDILLLPPLVSRICKKEKLKDEASKTICETNGSHAIEPALVSQIFFRCLIFDVYNISITFSSRFLLYSKSSSFVTKMKKLGMVRT